MARADVEIVACPDISDFYIALGAIVVLSCDIAMLRTDRKGWRDCYVGELIIRYGSPHQIATGTRIRNALAKVEMEYRAAGIATLELVLLIECFERIIGITDRKLRAVCVVRRVRRSCLYDSRELFPIFFREAVRGSFCGSCL